MTTTKPTFKPMLARSETLSPLEIETLPFPIVASPKLDGMRIVKLGGTAYTRNMLPLANIATRVWIERYLPNGIDGELCLPNMTEPLEDVMSAFRSKDGAPAFKFAAFDFFEGCEDKDFSVRLKRLSEAAYKVGQPDMLVVLRQSLVRDVAALRVVIQQHLEAGFEGTMVRNPAATYKQGRATLKGGQLLKIKPFHDEEATVIGFVEEMANSNETTTGTGRRSTSQEGLTGKGRLGAFKAKFADGTEFTVAGFTDAQKEGFWRQQETLLGQTITVKYQVVHGGRSVGQAPRHPQFKGFRPEKV